MNVAIPLRELIKRYTNTDILDAVCKNFTLFADDSIPLLNLIGKIRRSPDNKPCDKDIVLMMSFCWTEEVLNLVPNGGFRKNGRHYKFTKRNCSDIDKISCCNVQLIDEYEPIDDSNVSDYLPRTELELLTVILLSINAFSPEVVEYYFDGDDNKANSRDYILRLIENNDFDIDAE